MPCCSVSLPASAGHSSRSWNATVTTGRAKDEVVSLQSAQAKLRGCFCESAWVQTVQTVALLINAPAKISAGDTVMENEWMDGWIFKDLRYLHIRDSSAGMLVCWSLCRCCRFVVRVWSDVWSHSFLITGSDLWLNVFLLFLLLYLLFLLLRLR